MVRYPCMETSRFAFFDVDHTLTRHSTGRRFAFLGVREGIFPVSALLTMPFYYTCYRIGFMPLRKLDRSFPFIRGKTKEELEDLAAKPSSDGSRKICTPKLLG